MHDGVGLAGRRVLVVGASSGIGAAFARAAIRAGALVAVAARRRERLDELVEAAGAGVAVAGDVTDADDARRIVDEAAAALDGLDLVLYAAGAGALQRLEDTDPDLWQALFAVNVIGANLVCGAALRHLDTDGVVAFVSSRTVEDVNWGLLPYAATKAALDTCIRGWRVEHGDRRFVRIVMGNTQPTEFAERLDPDLLGPAIEAWGHQGIPGGMMHVDEVAAALVDALGAICDHPAVDSSELRFDARP